MPHLPPFLTARLAPALLALLPLLTAAPAAQAAGGGDLLADVPVVNEHAINDVACGQAAATMVLDYELERAGATSDRVGLASVARDIPFSYRYGVPTGTSPGNLARGLERAANALGIPLVASWQRVQPAGWEATLRRQLAAGDPVIVYLSDGGLLWNNAWRYGHYIVVSGFGTDGRVIYHDPFDGREHSIAAAAFGRIWGYGGHRTWTYLRISPE